MLGFGPSEPGFVVRPDVVLPATGFWPGNHRAWADWLACIRVLIWLGLAFFLVGPGTSSVFVFIHFFFFWSSPGVGRRQGRARPRPGQARNQTG